MTDRAASIPRFGAWLGSLGGLGAWVTAAVIGLLVAGQGPLSALHGLSHGWASAGEAGAGRVVHGHGHGHCGGSCAGSGSSTGAHAGGAGGGSEGFGESGDAPGQDDSCSICIRLVLVRAEGVSPAGVVAVAVFEPAWSEARSWGWSPAWTERWLVEEARGPPGA